VLRIGIVFLMLGVPVAISAQERDPWIGKTVLPRPGATLSIEGVAVDIRLQSFPTTVVDVDADRVRLRRGWIKKSDLMSPDETLAYCDEQIQHNKEDPRIWRLRALAWLGKGDARKSLYSLEESLRLDPIYSDALADRGLARAKTGDYESALRDYDEALRIDSTNPTIFYRRGYVWLKKELFENAITDCNQAIALDADCDVAFVFRGDAAFFQNELDSAIADYTSAVQKNPKNVAALRNRALCQMKRREVDQALVDIDQAIKIVPQESFYHWIRGCCLTLNGDYPKAIDSMTESLRLQPNQPAAYVARGRIFQLMNKEHEALDDFESAAALDRNNASSLFEVALSLATSPNDDVRDGRRAIEFAKKACEISKWQIDAFIAALAAGYAAKGDWENAIRYQKDAIEKTPEQARKRRQETLGLYEKHQPLLLTKQQRKEMLETGLSNVKPSLDDDRRFR
jgi:tetratricopeptide (TPR) repeat protein